MVVVGASVVVVVVVVVVVGAAVVVAITSQKDPLAAYCSAVRRVGSACRSPAASHLAGQMRTT